MNDWISTYTGRTIRPMDPSPEDICIEDIAHALSNLCRYTGHTSGFYSVAQHSALASQIVPPEDAKWALLHDASEAYLADVARPIKAHLTNYAQAECRLMKMVAERFELPWPMPESVHHADRVLLATEKRDLMAPCPVPWAWIDGIEPLKKTIYPMLPWWAEQLFLARFRELFDQSTDTLSAKTGGLG